MGLDSYIMNIIHHYTKATIKWPLLTLVALVIITLLLGSGLRKLEFDTSVETFLPMDDPEFKYYRTVKEIYGDVDTFVILAISHENLWCRETFSQIENLLLDLEEYQEYDAPRETRRLDRLGAYLNKEHINSDALFSDFADDPGFVRFLKRKLKINSTKPL